MLATIIIPQGTVARIEGIPVVTIEAEYVQIDTDHIDYAANVFKGIEPRINLSHVREDGQFVRYEPDGTKVVLDPQDPSLTFSERNLCYLERSKKRAADFFAEFKKDGDSGDEPPVAA